MKTKRLIAVSISVLLVCAPLIVVLMWRTWYEHTFDPMGRPAQNYTSISGLYGKSGICNKDTVLGEYPLTCVDIYRFCNREKPNIYTHEFGGRAYSEDKTETCEVFMRATLPFRIFFIPSVLLSGVLFIIGFRRAAYLISKIRF